MKRNKSSQQPETSVTASPSGIVGHGAPLADSTPNYSDLVTMYGNQFGTSGYGVIHAPAVAPVGDSDNREKWFAACESGATEPETLLSEGLQMLSKEVALVNSFMSLARRDETKKYITIGKMLNICQVLTKRANLKWQAWCSENVTFMSQRNIELYMRLASRVDAHPYDFLGSDRLDRLCSVTVDELKVVKDPIGAFMARHQIEYNPEAEFDFDAFSFDIDVAITMDRLAKNGLEGADINLVKAITRKQRKMESSLLGELKRIKKSGGDINVVLRDLALNRTDEAEPESEKRPKEFNKLSNGLIKSIDYIIRDPEQVDKIDAALFDNLLKKLLLLQKAKFGVVEAKAA